MKQNKPAKLEINNQTIKFSGQTILVISVSHIVQLVKGELQPVRKRPRIILALLILIALASATATVLAMQNNREHSFTAFVVALVLGGVLALVLVTRMGAWVIRKKEYGLLLVTAVDAFMISSKSDDLMTSILEAITARIEAKHPMPSVTFNVENLDMSRQSTKNINTQFVSAGRDATVGPVTQK